MSRSYSSNFLIQLESGVQTIGKDLARVCVNAKLPAAYVAEMLGTSRMTLHTWFRGGLVRQSKFEKIELFIKLIEEDTQRGVLPAKSVKQARQYAEDFIGRTLSPLNKKSD